MPRITIGIPAYNRPGFIRRTLASAVEQTCPDVEVLVSDDSTNDETAEVARSFGDRVRYHRNEKSLGMWPNFAKLTELARGDYFSWLQDDELVHRDFARRAVEALDADDRIALYSTYSADTHSYDTFVLPLILGPPIAVDWMNSRMRVVDGSMILPISFYLTFSMPPITAYRTDAIREAVRDINPAHVLFNERIVQSRAVLDRKVAVDPWIAGTFYKHEAQGSLLAGSTLIPERSRQWVEMANEISLMLESRPGDEWRTQLDDWLKGLAPHDLMTAYTQMAPPIYWSGLRPLALEACSRCLEFLPGSAREEHRMALNKAADPKRVLKDVGRQLTPPLVWNILRGLKSISG